MIKVRNRNHMLLAKPLKVYCTLISTLGVLTMCYFLWKNPDKDSKNPKYKESGYIFNENRQEIGLSRSLAFKGEKIVHLDLKGAPPKVAYYSSLFPLLSKLGATGVLMEYEDMFPYTGELSNISALNAYTLNDVSTINNLAEQNNLEVIPLVQTFGHLEFVLKLTDYKDYREVSKYPQVICPTNEHTLNLLNMMIEQVVSAHPNSKKIHIGADEVYYIGMCNRCIDFMHKYNFSKNILFIEHVNSVVSIINKLYPKMRILMWDDEFRSITPIDLKKSNLNKSIEPVVWKYTREVYEDLGPSLWDAYAKTFTKVWAASAFKGATGSSEFVSHVTHYLQNHRGWLSVVNEYKNLINFQGIIITGWQRYDHFAVLCELLPVGIPTLAMSLRLLLGYNDSPLSPPTEVAKILNCEQPYALIGSAFGSPRCSFPGGDVLECVLRLQQLKQEYESMMEDSRVKGWINDYNVEHVFSNPNHVETVTAPLGRIKRDLGQIDQDMTIAMSEVYDKFTIKEWKDSYIKPFEKKVDELWDARKKILAKNSWPRRPLERSEL